MDEKIHSLLREAAQEIREMMSKLFDSGKILTSDDEDAALQAILEKRFLKLLLAGEKMRQIWGPKSKQPWPRHWDAALKEARAGHDSNSP